jgi:hypothetical protein
METALIVFVKDAHCLGRSGLCCSTGMSTKVAHTVKAERQLSIIGAMAQSGSSKSSSQLERLRIREDLLETYEGTPLRDVVKALECIAPLQNAGDWVSITLS